MRIIIVSNRLPFTLEKRGEKYIFKESAGGVTTGLSSYLKSMPKEDSYVWLGWPGATIEDPETQKLIQTKALKKYNAFPIFLSKEVVDDYYNGFCNQILWPLFHNFTSFVRLYQKAWSSYLKANEQFAKAVLKIYRPGDLILIQDFHLMPLPGLIREKHPDALISFFLHVPFPQYQFYKLLPKNWRNFLLRGILGSDLLGFHTSEYVRNLKTALLSEFGIEAPGQFFSLDNRPIQIGAFPLGINVASFQKISESLEVLEKREKYRKALTTEKLILSVDRLDYTKGITNKIEGFAQMLRMHPEWQGKVSLVVIAAPSRTSIVEFRKTREEIEKRVGEVNGELGTLSWTPVLYQFKTYSQEDLIALYGLADIALITPIRDGMNLTAKEYLASRVDKKGVLVLSRMAGAAHELKEAVLVNPFHKESIASGIFEALNMSEEERVARNTKMVERLKAHDVFHWAKSFNQALVSIGEEVAIPFSPFPKISPQGFKS